MNRTQRARLWALHRIPDGLLFHPAEWFLASLCLFSGARVLILGAVPASLESALPAPLYFLWGLMLVIGAAAHMSGLTSIRALDFDRYVVTRVPAYRLGLRLLGGSTALYAIALVGYAGSSGLVAGLFPLAFSGMCGVRLLKIGGR